MIEDQTGEFKTLELSDAEAKVIAESAATCPASKEAAARVQIQLNRLKERLLAKAIIPLFCFELFVFNCDRHGGPAHHIDLVTSELDTIGQDGLPHVIAAAEALVISLKKRMA